MKKTIKIASVLLALVMVFASMTTNVFAQTVDSGKGGEASITISNAANGETYAVYKLFDASVTGTANGSIAYTGTIPAELSTYFVADTAGNISATEAAISDGELSDEAVAALTAWAASQTATASVEADGSAVVFTGLEYGYYVVTTTQGNTDITVTSTNPNAVVYDKNTTTPTLVGKTVNDQDVYVGQEVTYTVTYTTSNYNGEAKILSYTIEDTLPSFLSNVTVESITIDGVSLTDDNNQVPQFVDKKITIDWVDDTDAKNSLYANGAKVVITYKATVTAEAAIAGNGNDNTVTLTWVDDDPNNEDPEPQKASATIYTYAIALKKVNEKGEALAGATFEFPFYVKATNEANVYLYAGTVEADGLNKSLTTPADDGVIIVKGLPSDENVIITETVAPDGYNKLTGSVTIDPVATTQTTTTTSWWVGADGSVYDVETDETTKVIYENNDLAVTAVLIVNNSGSTLPSTGGIGTTIFYVVGAVLVLGAVVLLVTKRRMGSKG